MKLLTFVDEYNDYKLGVVTPQGVLDITSSVAVSDRDYGSVPSTVMQVIGGGSLARKSLAQFVEHSLADGSAAEYLRQEAELKLGPCVTHPNKIICVGLNYAKHAEESKAKIPEYPVLFNKFNNTLAGHLEDIPLPRSSQKVDYEAELCVVIGKTAKYVTEAEALDYVFGYCNVNDLSARDLQMRTGQWLAGKSCDKFSPLGPYLVTADEVGDPNDLEIKSIVNGEVRQHSNTSDMIFNVKQIVADASNCMTLAPGDIILTGTPFGVVLGYPPEKQEWLKPGDVVTIEIEKLGALTNTMVSE